MDFYKKVLVLKQVSEGYSLPDKKLSGIVRTEIEDGFCELYLSFVNVAAAKGGEFFLFLLDNSANLVKIPLGKRPTALSVRPENVPDFSHGFCAGLFFIENDVPELVAYCACEKFNGSALLLKKAVTDACIEKRKERAKILAEKIEEEINNEQQIESPSENTTQTFYDDEAVATENYFDEEFLNDTDENARTFDCGEQEKEKEKRFSDGVQNEKSVNCGEKYTIDNPYFDHVRDEVNDVLEKFPSESALSSAIPFSKWAKVNYSDDKYYVVGVVTDGKKEKYICYGVPGNFSEYPPEQLAGFCSFVPSSIFIPDGNGYWMMFQDAITGECIKMNEKKSST